MHSGLEAIQLGLLTLGLAVGYLYFDVYPAWDVQNSKVIDLMWFILAGWGAYVGLRLCMAILWWPFHQIHRLGYLFSSIQALVGIALSSIPYFILTKQEHVLRDTLELILGAKWWGIATTQAEAMTTEGFVFIRLWILIFVVTQMILTPCIYAGSKLLFRM